MAALQHVRGCILALERPGAMNPRIRLLDVIRIAACLIAPAFTIGVANAQVGETLLLPSVVPSGFDRGHNQAVTELSQKDFAPAGIRIGSFDLFPSIRSAVGSTTNTYYTSDPIGSAFLSNTPTANLESKWSRHQLSISGTGTFREYVGQSRRNESVWQVDVDGRIDLGNFTKIYLDANSSERNESQFTGEVTPTVAALSRYRRDIFSARAENSVNRMRFTVAADYALFRFQPVPLLTGDFRDQENRNRAVGRVTGQWEYARSPDLAFFVQASYADQSFTTDLRPGVPNVDSRGYRALAGFNFDDPGFARGSLGIGYTRQDFVATLYKPVSGLSVQGRLEFFPTRLTTVRVDASRTVEITNLSLGGAAYWSNRLAARVDREIWRRIIVSATAGYARQSFVSNGATTESFQLGAGAQYLSSRNIAISASIDYGRRRASASTLGASFGELRTEVGMTYRI